MSHLDYYRFQATARGVFSLKDIIAGAEQRAYIYDRIVLPWLSKKSPRVVELACGHGSFLWWLKARGFERAKRSWSRASSRLPPSQPPTEQVLVHGGEHGRPPDQHIHEPERRQIVRIEPPAGQYPVQDPE